MLGPAVEYGVGGPRGVEGGVPFPREEVAAEESAVELVGLRDQRVPAGQLEGGFVAEVVVLPGDGAVDLEGAVFEEAEGGADGVGDARILFGGGERWLALWFFVMSGAEKRGGC